MDSGRLSLNCIVSITFLFLGCAHQFVIREDAPPERYAQAQNFLGERSAKINLHSEKVFHVENLHIGQDSTVFSIEGQTDRIVLMNERIRSIVTQDIESGLQTGALIGGVCGGIVGFFVGVMVATIDPRQSDPSVDGNYHSIHEENDGMVIFQGFGIGAGVGCALGALIGSQNGAKNCVIMYPDPKDPRRWEYLPR